VGACTGKFSFFFVLSLSHFFVYSGYGRNITFVEVGIPSIETKGVTKVNCTGFVAYSAAQQQIFVSDWYYGRANLSSISASDGLKDLPNPITVAPGKPSKNKNK
jgi:hypothetical protein